MNPDAQRQKRRGAALSSLNAAIEVSNVAKESCSITPAKAVFSSFSLILTMIKDSSTNKADCVELGKVCADVCIALGRELNGKQSDNISDSVSEAVKQLTTMLTEIEMKITKRGKRNPVSRLLHAKKDKETIASWKLDLNKILLIFNTELTINTNVTVATTHTMVCGIRSDVATAHTIFPDVRNGVVNTPAIVSDIHRTVTEDQRRADGNNQLAQISIPSESPPSPPQIFFGRNEWIERIIDLAEHLTSIALIGVGGIGKTSIALTVLHDDRIKQRFGDNRRFIRCDRFTASLANFLARLSEVIGASVGNPDSLTPLRPFLSSKEMVIVLDNAESILDPQGTDAQEIYAVVEELSRFDNICLCITSRITTIPPDCETLDIPTLSMEAALDTFYRIHKGAERSDLVRNILEQLEFHPLSITLLTTVAYHNKWDTGRLTREWERQRTGVLRTKHSKSLAATIELSLSSPMFQELGPDARDLLGIIAFFPQGVDENNLNWLFPTTSNKSDIFDTFCILSLAYRSNGFIMMLGPLRDYLSPKDSKSSPLLCKIKNRYFSRLSLEIYPDKPNFDEARWITLEDTNVEHLLSVFTSTDANSDEVWDACHHFMEHLSFHKPRIVSLEPKIKGLPDNHPSKPKCLYQLAWLFAGVGSCMESKRLFTHSLKLWRERGNDLWVAKTLWSISHPNRMLGLNKEGIQQSREGLEIYERLNDVSGQARSLCRLSYLLKDDGQLDAARGAAEQVIDRFSGGDEQVSICGAHRLLSDICRRKGETEKAMDHLQIALGIASSFSWDNLLFWIHDGLARTFFDKGEFDDAHAHIELAKSHAVNDTYLLGYAAAQGARFWYRQGRFEEARSAASHAIDFFERLGATKKIGVCRALLLGIERAAKH